MNSLVLIIIAIAALIVGLIIGWLMANSKSKILRQQFVEMQQSNAVLGKEVELLQSTLEEYKKRVSDKDSELQERQNFLTNALQLKVAAETSLGEANKTIAELQKDKNDSKAELRELEKKLNSIRENNVSLDAQANATMKRLDEQQQFLENAEKTLKDAFGTLSANALQNNNSRFVELAKATLEEKVTETKGQLEKKHQAIEDFVKPLSDSLTKMDEKINALESKREGAYSQMNTLLDQMKQSTNALDKETKSLVNALKTSNSRGRYGEIALRRLVEFAGMVEHCDFEEQVSIEGESGRLRPDMIIRLPEHRRVVVDSKVPLTAYLEMFETEDQSLQKQFMDKHIIAVKSHLKQLGGKAYWDQFVDTPDFVVMFMQIESSFGAALQAWPGMIEEALNNRIIIATPTTLITILRSIGYSWNQLKTMENIESIRDAAVELYERSATLMEHISNIGKGLTSTINYYNKAVGSLEGSFLPQGRRVNQLAQGFIKKSLPDISQIEATVREVLSPTPELSNIQMSASGKGVEDNQESESQNQ